MARAREFHARKYLSHEKKKCDDQWEIERPQYEAASYLTQMYYVGKHFLGGECVL
jgi:hypothetical protein